MLSKLKLKIEHAHFAEQLNRWSYRLGLPGSSFDRQQENLVLGVDRVNKLISTAIENKDAVLFSRLGSIEVETALIHFNLTKSLNKRLAELYSHGIALHYNPVRKRIKVNAGVFPTTNEALSIFAEIYIESTSKADYLINWQNLRNHKLAASNFGFRGSYVEPIPVLPTERTTWTKSLKNKKVLVIHPFKETIQRQYEKRKVLFNDPEFLPDFELICLKAVMSNGYEEVKYLNWKEALYDMMEQVRNIQFDVCLIGAGAYGLPLGAFVKRNHKVPVIHIGGGTQLLFGIKGNRWDNWEWVNSCYNKHWVRPSEQETPKGAKLIEGATYW